MHQDAEVREASGIKTSMGRKEGKEGKEELRQQQRLK